MSTDRYFICGACAHFVASPEWPDRCENCGAGPLTLTSRATLDAAEACSQDVLDARTGA